MSGFIEGEDRTQATLFPERIDDYITFMDISTVSSPPVVWSRKPLAT
jgi:hypothetical protein